MPKLRWGVRSLLGRRLTPVLRHVAGLNEQANTRGFVDNSSQVTQSCLIVVRVTVTERCHLPNQSAL